MSKSVLSVTPPIPLKLYSAVDRLQAEARYVLQCASVIGRLFRYRLLQHISQQERNLDKHITEFESKELIYEERTVPELEYAFKHAFTQEATYEGILEQQRREFHYQVADGIERLYMIDRTIYCGAYKEGAATVFRNFRIWTRG